MYRAVVVMAIVLGAAAVGGCAGTGPGGAPPSHGNTDGRSGVRGVTVVDTGCPVLPAGSTCPQTPLPARVVVLDAGTQERVAEVRSGADGLFEVEVPPGRYELRGENLTGTPVPVALPISATVSTGRFTEVRIEFDSGVRGAPS